VDDETFERVRGGGWDLPTLQKAVDQFVMHYDVCGTARQCFNILHDHRCLSVHFMLDVDGTIYQTLDLKERAWHATTSNSRSIGIEIANIGAYPPEERKGTLDQWLSQRSRWANALGAAGVPGPQQRDSHAELHRAPDSQRGGCGTIQGKKYRMYDLTPQQYQSLIKLTATLCTVFPKINCEVPREANNAVIPHVLDAEALNNYQGVMGHYHVQDTKQDPGPAFQWDRVIYGAQALMTEEARRANREALGHPALAVNNAPVVAPSTAAKQATTQPATAPATAPATNNLRINPAKPGPLGRDHPGGEHDPNPPHLHPLSDPSLRQCMFAARPRSGAERQARSASAPTRRRRGDHLGADHRASQQPRALRDQPRRAVHPRQQHEAPDRRRGTRPLRPRSRLQNLSRDGRRRSLAHRHR
jgi:N-acetyl-anhydromuramyl-L-alanine amidase AmpD